MSTKLHQLAGVGQSIWLDYIRRTFVLDGELARLVNQGVRGVTSNPSIFEKAIAGSDDYDAQLTELCGQGLPAVEVYEALALRDIQMAADTLRTVYEATEGLDGYVSLEVSPDLAHDTGGTVAEARRLFSAIGRPNVFIKVPATAEGIPAIETLIGEGINVNVTLMFSLDQYDAVAEAYLVGLERLDSSGGSLASVASVASFFVSRVDVMVDEMLDGLGSAEARGLKGKIAIANAKMAYQRFKQAFSGARWEKLAAKGARVQRPLWASTSTKDPDYPDTIYVDNLVGAHTVNTVPPETLEALLDHARVDESVEEGLDEARQQLAQLGELGIDLDAVTDALLVEGVEKFAKPFASLMGTISGVCGYGAHGQNTDRLSAELGEGGAAVEAALAEMEADEIVTRIWAHDYFVWQAEPTDITNRLGWLESPAVMRRHLERIDAFVDDVRNAGFTHALLLGMGGSSLAPEVFSTVFGPVDGYLKLEVLDSTEPGAVLGFREKLDLAKTLFIVSSKSGGTTETLSFFRYFYEAVSEVVGEDRAGDHFIAITDPRTKLVALAQDHKFRAIFRNDPTIGGRYSALSYFGLVPAGLAGVDLARLLDSTLALTYDCSARAGKPPCSLAGSNLGARLGVIMGEMAKAGRDKLTLITAPRLAPFADWIEQLIAESTGKSGTGVLPVVGEPLGAPEDYGNDRVFVYIKLGDDDPAGEVLATLKAAGHPVVTMTLGDVYDLGEQLMIWGLAVPIAGHRMGIHPFDQPNVEAAKQQAKRLVDAYKEDGELPAEEAAPVEAEALHSFLAQAEPGDYIALQAYLTPNDATAAALQELRARLRDRYKLATTVGYGPRYLHSTGQLHKGDAGRGLFVQFTTDPVETVWIPDEAATETAASNESGQVSFDVLVRSQALGDRQALLDAGRRVIHFRLGHDVVAELAKLAAR
jgi:transaldolase / glucose-6-phosphate isomerase